MMPAILYVPVYWILRLQGVYFQPPEFVPRDLFTLLAWIGFLLYIIKVRPQYRRFLFSAKVGGEEDVEDSLGSSKGIRVLLQDRLLSEQLKSRILKPETQVIIGKLGAALVIVYGLYFVLDHKFYMAIVRPPPPRLLLVLLLFLTVDFAIPGVYIYGLTFRKIRATKAPYYVWLGFLAIWFLPKGFPKLIVMGDFAEFPLFWAPLGIITIFWWVGLRGVTRIAKPETISTTSDTVTHILMCVGVFLGFFCGAKITHDFLALHWPDVSDYDKVRRLLPCLIGAVAGSVVGCYVAGWTGFFIEGQHKAEETKDNGT